MKKLSARKLNSFVVILTREVSPMLESFVLRYHPAPHLCPRFDLVSPSD